MTIDPTAKAPTTTTFADAVEALTTLGPVPSKKKKKTAPKLTKQSPPHYAASEAWAWDSLEEWPNNPPIESLHLYADTPPGLGNENDEPSAKRFMDWANFGSVIGTWNARDKEGKWASERGQWIVVRAELSRGGGEDGDDGGVCVAIACWKVAEGYAIFITGLGGDRTRVPAIMGMARPETWKTEAIWYGE